MITIYAPGATVEVVTKPIWTAGMESGNLLEWEYPNIPGSKGGGEFNDAGADSVASNEQSHTGQWSAKLQLTTQSSTKGVGTRLFRWNEPRLKRELFYSSWFYFPTTYAVAQPPNWNAFFNIMQWKSVETGVNDPIWIVGVAPLVNGKMRLNVSWWPNATLVPNGPQNGQSGPRTWLSTVDVPVARWFNVEARLVSADDFTGAVQVWQDGVELFNVTNCKTRYPSSEIHWSVNCYGRDITPAPVNIYADDVAISTARVWRG